MKKAIACFFVLLAVACGGRVDSDAESNPNLPSEGGANTGGTAPVGAAGEGGSTNLPSEGGANTGGSVSSKGGEGGGGTEERPTLTVSLDPNQPSRVLMAGERDVPVYSVELTAGDQDVVLPCMNFGINGTTDHHSTTSGALERFTIVVDGVSVKKVQYEDVSYSNAIWFDGPIAIPANSEVNVKILADIGERSVSLGTQFRLYTEEAHFSCNARDPYEVNGNFRLDGSSFIVGYIDAAQLTITKTEDPSPYGDSEETSKNVVGQAPPFVYGWYKASNKGDEPLVIDSLTFQQINLNGKMTDFAQVILGDTGGAYGGVAIVPQAANEDAIFSDVDASWLTVPAHGETVFPVSVRMAETVSSSSAGPNSPMSGDTPQLELVAASANDRAVQAIVEAQNRPFLVLRKSLPYLTQLQLPPQMILDGGEVTLAKWQVTAYQAGDIAWKSMVLEVRQNGLESIENLTLYKGAFQISDVRFRSNFPDGGVGYVVIDLDYQELVTQSGSLYSLRGTTNVRSNPSPSVINIVTEKLTSLNENPNDGYISCTIPSGANHQVWITDTKDGVGEWYTNLLWSDLSEVPHSPACGESFDWIDDWGTSSLSWTING